MESGDIDQFWLIYTRDGELRTSSSRDVMDLLSIILEVQPQEYTVIFGQNWDKQLCKMAIRKNPEILEDRNLLNLLLGSAASGAGEEEKEEEEGEDNDRDNTIDNKISQMKERFN